MESTTGLFVEGGALFPDFNLISPPTFEMKLTSLAVAAALAGLASAQIPSRPPTWVLNQSTIIVSPLLPCVSPKKKERE
jgi:hypothetical protein